jgi:hypothetical protein
MPLTLLRLPLPYLRGQLLSTHAAPRRQSLILKILLKAVLLTGATPIAIPFQILPVKAATRTQCLSSTNNMADSSGSDVPLGNFFDDDASDAASEVLEPRVKRGRPTLDPLADGPPVLVAVVGSPSGRWLDLFSDEKALAVLNDARFGAGLPSAALAPYSADAAGGQSYLLGFSIVCSWRYVLPSSTIPVNLKMLMAHLRSKRDRRTTLGFLEYSSLEPPVSMVAPLALDRDEPCGPILTPLWHRLVDDPAIIVQTGFGRQQSLHNWYERAKLKFNKSFDICFSLNLWTPLAEAFAKGEWAGDVVAVVKLDRSKLRLLGAGPSKGKDKKYLDLLAGRVVESLALVGSDECRPVVQNATVRIKGSDGYGFLHILRALKAGRKLMSSKHLEQTSDAMVDYLCPNAGEASELRAKLLSSDFQHPHADTLDRALVRMDVAGMKIHRDLYGETGPFFRYINYDASKKHGIEIFCTTEDYVPQAAVLNKSVEEVDCSLIKTRVMAVTTLAQGCAGIIDKGMNYQHQTWCDYGSSPAHHAQANEDVRLGLSDMGVEFYILDCKDIVASFYKAFHNLQLTVDDIDTSSFTFKYGMRCAGTMHIVDWLLVSGLEAMPFWTSWMKHAQALSAFLRNTGYRKAMLKALADLAATSGDRSFSLDIRIAIPSLASFSATLADWRWDTAYAVSMELAAVQFALVLLSRAYGSRLRIVLGIGKGVMYASAELAFGSDDFWSKPSFQIQTLKKRF